MILESSQDDQRSHLGGTIGMLVVLFWSGLKPSWPAGSGTEFLVVLMLPRAASEPGYGLRFWS
jgi:hypothetical protein